MDGQTAIDTAVVTALGDHPSLEDIAIYKNTAPPKILEVLPYIMIEHMKGGLLNDSPHDTGDVHLLITAISRTSPEAKSLSGFIEEALKNQVLDFTDGWASWSTVRQTDFFSKSIVIQNDQYHKVGAIYRFRATKAKG